MSVLGINRRMFSAVRGVLWVAAVSGMVTATATAQTARSASAQGSTLSIGMVQVPGGTFEMGSCLTATARDVFLGQACPDPDYDAKLSETPQHAVTVKPFQISKTEITLGQFKKFIVATGRMDLVDDEFMRYNNQGDNAPVVRVSWNDAQAFVQWLNRIDGSGWRLPTEAEWEYACRAGGTSRFCSGSDDIAQSAWSSDNSNGRHHTVALKLPNAWGIHDMAGNVWEWVQDCWTDSYVGAPTNGSAVDGGQCAMRVLRGGAWTSPIWEIRAATRGANTPTYRGNHFGFRVARSGS